MREITRGDISKVFKDIVKTNSRLYLRSTFDIRTCELTHVLCFVAKDGHSVRVTSELTTTKMYHYLMRSWLQGYKDEFYKLEHEIIAL